MSEPQLIQIIKNILGLDNQLRQQSEAQLKSILSSEPNGLFCILSNIIKTSQQPDVKSFCAVYMKNKLSMDNDQESALVAKLSSQTLSMLKATLLFAMENETNKSQKHVLCEVIGELGGSLIKRPEWQDLLPYLLNLLIQQEMNQVDSGLRTLTSMIPYTFLEILPHQENIIQLIKLHIQNQALMLQATQLFAAIVKAFISEDLPPFQVLVPYIIQILKSQQQLSEVLICVQDMVEADPKFLQSQFSSLFDIMKAIVFDKSKEQSVKEQATEIIICMVERLPKLVKNQESKIKVLMEMVVYHMIEIDSDISPTWERPPEGFNDNEDDIDDETIKFGIHSIDRLINSIGEKIMLTNLSQLVQKLFKQQDWRYKHAAIMSLSQVGEYIDDIQEVAPIVNLVLSYNKDPHSKIRYSICHCIGQISDDMKPEFQDHYHEKVIECMWQLLNDPVPRVQSHALSCLTNFFEGMHKSSIQKYIRPMLQKFIELSQNSISIVKESVVDALANLADTAEEDFQPYYEDVMLILFKMFDSHMQPEYRVLRGKIIQTLTMISQAVKWPFYQKYVNTMIESMLIIQQDKYTLEDSNIQIYLLSGWQRLCQSMDKDFIPFFPKIIPSLFSLIKNILSSDYLTAKVKTGETEEAQNAIQVLNTFVSVAKEQYQPYVDTSFNLLIQIINFNAADEAIKKQALECLPKLIQVTKEKDFAATQELVKQMITMVWKSLELEQEPDIIEAGLLCISDFLNEMNSQFMTEQDIKEFQVRIFKTLVDCEERKKQLDEREENEVLEQQELDHIEEHREEEQAVHIAVSELIGILFKTQKELACPFAIEIYNNVLNKALSQSSESSMKRLGLNIMNDMLEYLPMQRIHLILSYFSFGMDKFQQCVEAFFKFSTDKDWLVRQAACQGIGMIAKVHTAIFLKNTSTYVQKIRDSLSVQRASESRKEYDSCKDRTVSCLLSMIKSIPQDHAQDKQTVISLWLENLPLKTDKFEYIDNHHYLAKLVNDNPEDIISNQGQNSYFRKRIGQIVKIFAQILDTKFANQETNDLIRIFLQKIFRNQTIRQNWEEIIASLTEKQKMKLQACESTFIV